MRTYSIYPDEFPEPWASDWGEDEYGLWMGFTYKGVKQFFRWIEPGTFKMGSPNNEQERFDDEIYHSVKISRGFWLADCTVTQALWQVVMGANPSSFIGENHSVEGVSWAAAQMFIGKLNGLKSDLKLCLPTEAQWEYACRAGTVTPFSFGDNMTTDQANYNGNYSYAGAARGEYRENTVVVKTLPPNPWGLYETHGNVWEWCQDWYGEYPTENITDPQGPEAGANRVLRGGSWVGSGRGCRSANRNFNSPDDANDSIGFRLARGH